MSIPMEIIAWLLGFLGTGILTGLGFILKTLNGQNKALALLVAQVGTLNGGVIEKRLIDLETDMARVWGIYDAWRGPSTPTAVERLSNR